MRHVLRHAGPEPDVDVDQALLGLEVDVDRAVAADLDRQDGDGTVTAGDVRSSRTVGVHSARRAARAGPPRTCAPNDDGARTPGQRHGAGDRLERDLRLDVEADRGSGPTGTRVRPTGG